MLTERDLHASEFGRPLRFAMWIVDKGLAPLLQAIVARIPPLERYLASTIQGRLGDLGRLMQQNRFAEAFEAALDGAAAVASRGRMAFDSEDFFWWSFAKEAVTCADALGPSARPRVATLVESAQWPGGVYESMCREQMARWLWSTGARDGAIAMVRRAVRADPSSPSPVFLLAWYGLVTSRFDPLPLLRHAVRLSPDYLEMIRSNAQFAQRPDLLAALT